MFIKKLIFGAWGCVLLTLTGCAVSRDTAWEAYEKAQVCCESLSQLHYEKLPSERVQTYDIDERSQMFAFGTGRSFVLGIELPTLPPPLFVRLKSFALGDSIRTAYLFYPLILILDNQYKTLSRIVPPADMALSKAGLSESISENRGGLMTKYQWDVPVNDQGARYLVIHTDARKFDSGVSRQAPIFIPVILPGLITVLPTGQKEEILIPFSAFGRISLQVQSGLPSLGSPQE